ncbi:MAG: hypothetical protein MJ014_06455 [Methanocorpusculum sp.]|nr:hypothetical protein [Methanocorpusculum sp.]
MTKSDSTVSEVVGRSAADDHPYFGQSCGGCHEQRRQHHEKKPVNSTINVTFENIAGDAFVLDLVELRLGIREYPSPYTTIRGSSHLKSYSGLATISLGDRFYIQSDEENVLRRDSFNVSSGSHLTYRFYDLRTGSSISSGEIAVP